MIPTGGYPSAGGYPSSGGYPSTAGYPQYSSSGGYAQQIGAGYPGVGFPSPGSDHDSDQNPKQPVPGTYYEQKPSTDPANSQ